VRQKGRATVFSFGQCWSALLHNNTHECDHPSHTSCSTCAAIASALCQCSNVVLSCLTRCATCCFGQSGPKDWTVTVEHTDAMHCGCMLVWRVSQSQALVSPHVLSAKEHFLLCVNEDFILQVILAQCFWSCRLKVSLSRGRLSCCSHWCRQSVSLFSVRSRHGDATGALLS